MSTKKKTGTMLMPFHGKHVEFNNLTEEQMLCMQYYFNCALSVTPRTSTHPINPTGKEIVVRVKNKWLDALEDTVTSVKCTKKQDKKRHKRLCKLYSALCKQYDL